MSMSSIQNLISDECTFTFSGQLINLIEGIGPMKASSLQGISNSKTGILSNHIIGPNFITET